MAHIAYSTQQRMASAFPKSLMFKGSEFEVYEEGEILDDGPERIPQYLNMITSTSMEMLGSKYCRRFDNSWVKGSEAIQREGFGRFGSEAFQSEGFGRFCVGESSGYANSKEVGWNENFLPLSDSNFDTTAWAQAVRKRSYFHKDELGLQAFAKRRRLEISSRGLNINVSKGIQYNLKGSSAHHAFSFGRNLSLARKGLGNNYSQSYMLLDKNERTSCEMCRTVHSQASCSLMGPIYGNCEVKDEAITNIKGLNTGYLSFGVCLNGNQEMPEKGVRNEVGSVIGESKTLNHKVKVTGTLNMVKGTDRSSVVIPDCNINATSSSKIKFALKHFSLLVSDCNSDASCTMNTDKIVQRNELKEVDHKDILTQKERIGISSSLAKPSSCKQESTIRSLSENDKSRIEEWHSKFQARRLQKKVERGLCYLKIRQKKQFSNQQASQQKLGCSSLAEEFLAGAVNADRSLVEVFQKLCKVLLVFEEICSSESTVWKGLWNMIHAKLSIAVYHTFHEIQFLFKAQEITTEKEQQLDEETLRRVLELAYDFCEKLLRLKQIPELECTMQIIQGILGNAEFVGSSKQGQVFILMQSLIKDILQEIESQMEELSTSIAIDTMPIENSKSEDSVKSEVFTSTGADEDIAETDLPKVAPAISTGIPQSHKSIGSLSGMAFESARNSCSTADLKLDSSSISLDQTVSVECTETNAPSDQKTAYYDTGTRPDTSRLPKIRSVKSNQSECHTDAAIDMSHTTSIFCFHELESSSMVLEPISSSGDILLSISCPNHERSCESPQLEVACASLEKSMDSKLPERASSHVSSSFLSKELLHSALESNGRTCWSSESKHHDAVMDYSEVPSNQIPSTCFSKGRVSRGSYRSSLEVDGREEKKSGLPTYSRCNDVACREASASTKSYCDDGEHHTKDLSLFASHGGHSGHVNEQPFSILAVPNQKFQVNKSARFTKKTSPDAQDSKDFCFSTKPVIHILDVKHEELHPLELHNISDRGRSRKIFELTKGLDEASISVLQNSNSKSEATWDIKKENIAENNASINNSDVHHHMDIELSKDGRSAKSFETRKDSHLFKDRLKESSDTPLDNAQRLEVSLEKRALPIDSRLKVERASSDSKKTPLPSLEHNYINQGGPLLNNRAEPFLEQIPSSMSQSGMRSDVQKLCLSSNFLLSVDLAEFDSHSCTSFSCTEVDDAKSSTRVEYSYNQRLSDEESSDSQQRGDCSKTLTADLPLEDPYNNKKLLWKQDFQRRSLEQDRMLHAGKLCLVLDLDHTLLNSAKFSEIEPEWKHKLCAIQSKYRSRHGNGIRKRELHCCTNLGMWTKLRPGIWRFLAKASELYELHLYTMGNKVYATQMAKLLDPTGELFAGRIISKGDDDNDKQAKIKNLNGVLGMESAVLIVDDSARVWPFHRENLIGVERYMYFPCTRRQFGLPGPSLLEAGRDEREVDGMLLSTLAVLTKIHKAFFERCPLGERPDVRGLLAAEQQRILQGCGIVFSRVFPHGESQPQLHPLWQLAEQFGAKCSTSTDNSTTHIVAVSLGTDKIRWARANGRYVVNRQWLEASAVLYRRANEKHFPVTAHPRASAVLYRRSNEKQFPGTSPDRIDQRASSTTT